MSISIYVYVRQVSPAGEHGATGGQRGGSPQCVYVCLCLSMSTCDRSARLVNMAPLVANGEALHNGDIELYLQRNLGKHHGSGCEIILTSVPDPQLFWTSRIRIH
jgi:hypothetical protein